MSHTKEPWVAEDQSVRSRSGLIANVMDPERPNRRTHITEANTRRIVACVNQCIGLDTDRLEKMVPGTLANLLGLKASRSQVTEAQIAEIIDKRMVKACYEPMGKEIAALIVAANLLTLKGPK